MKTTIAALLMSASVAVLASTLGAQQRSAPRVAPVPDAQRTEEQRSIATAFAAAGMTNAVGALLHYPALAQPLLTHERYVSESSTLPPRHRLLLLLRASWLARSDYLWAHRAAAARRAGFTAGDLRRIGDGGNAAGWEPFEADLLRAADELHVDSFISDATWRALSARYDTNQMIDLIDTVGATTMHAGVLNSLGVQTEPGVTERRPEAPYRPTAKRTNIRLLGREPRIPPIPARNADGTVRQSANVFNTFVRNPPADRVRGAINTHVNSRSTLMPKHRELLLMRIGILCRSEYEYAAHARAGRRAGMTDADVARILAGPGGGDALEDALLRATDELFEHDAVSGDTWKALAAALDTRQLLDVLIAVGAYRSTSMLINSAGVQLDANMKDFRFPQSLR